MSNPSGYDLSNYPPRQQPSPLGMYPALETNVLDALDRLEADFPGLTHNATQVIAHVLAYTQTQSSGLLDLAVIFVRREQANPRTGQPGGTP